MALLQGSGTPVVTELFLGTVTSTGALEPFRLRHDSAKTRTRKVDAALADFQRSLAESTTAAAEGGVSRRAETVGAQYKASLALLIEKMNACRYEISACRQEGPWGRGGGFFGGDMRI